MDANQDHPQPADYRLFIEREWADLHHSRMQEWSALGVVVGIHLAITQVLSSTEVTEAPQTVGDSIFMAIAFAFAGIGATVTLRHRHLMVTKFGWIFKAEKKLGLVRSSEDDDENAPGILPPSTEPRHGIHWRKLELPRLLSTSGLILMFYLTLAAYDLIQIVRVWR